MALSVLDVGISLTPEGLSELYYKSNRQHLLDFDTTYGYSCYYGDRCFLQAATAMV
jgi:hypothetical protein